MAIAKNPLFDGRIVMVHFSAQKFVFCFKRFPFYPSVFGLAINDSVSGNGNVFNTVGINHRTVIIKHCSFPTR